MAQITPSQNSMDQLFARISGLEERMAALAAQLTRYITVGNSDYVLDSSGNAQIIIGDMSGAPSGIGTTAATFNTSTGLTGRGIAINVSGTWRSLAAYTYP